MNRLVREGLRTVLGIWLAQEVPPTYTTPGPTRPNKLHIILSTHQSYPVKMTAVSLRCIPEVSHSNLGGHKLNGAMYRARIATKHQSIYIAVLCAMACCSSVGEYRRFNAIYRCYLQGYILNYEHLWGREPTGDWDPKLLRPTQKSS